MSYTKMFSSILDSTIWQETQETKLVWITMLAMSDKNGEVQSSIPGLAARAGVPLTACESAIEKLRSPDKYSRTKDDEGRRIEEIDGGWFLLNHAKYRNMASEEDRKEKAAIRARRCYEKAKINEKPNNVLTLPNPPLTPTSLQKTQADTDTDSNSDPISIYCPESRVALHFLNEQSGRKFRETSENLGFICARLAEPEVTIEGVRKMIERQCRIWKGTEQEEYLRPQTLFNKTKFDAYYAGKDLPIPSKAVNGVKKTPFIDTIKGPFA